MDFGALPPEINSGRMYLGPGSEPMMTAASAWDTLAAELSITATGYGSVISELTGHGWLGPAALAMAGAAAPYVAWLHSTAAQAAQTAAQAKVAAAAYEFAFTMTVPPPVIAANRSLLLALVATNFFGQNTPAIAATEAHYAQMWLQDAAAMYGYAGSSAAASLLTPFTTPQPTSNAAVTQSTTLSQLLSTTAAALQQLAAPTAPVSPATLLAIIEHVPNVTNSVLSTSNAVASGRGIYVLNERLAFQEAQDAERSAEFGSRLVSTTPVRLGGSPLSAVSAGLGRATLVGKLSVPPGWLAATPEIQPVALALPDSATGTISAASAGAPLAPGSAFSQSVLGTLSRRGADIPAHKSKPIIVRSPAAG
ncbi:MAG: PPE family protein [Mycobacterium sp.]